MTSLHQLESAAREQRPQVEKTLGNIKPHAQFPTIAHEAIGLSNLWHRGSPLIAAGGIDGAVWLIKKYLGRKIPGSSFI